jgi:hypothetical protein
MSETTKEAIPFRAPPGGCQQGTTLTVTVSTVSTQVQTGVQVRLLGTAQEVHWTVDCTHSTTKAPFHWSLSFQAPGGTETDITSSLHSANTLNPFFIPGSQGTYRATLTASSGVDVQTEAVVITAVPPQTVSITVSGHITTLLVQDVGQGFGPADDSIDVEVVIQLDTQPGKGFGFQLRNDKNRPARQGMFDLLEDAFDSNRAVSLTCQIVPGKNNGTIFQTMLTK